MSGGRREGRKEGVGAKPHLTYSEAKVSGSRSERSLRLDMKAVDSNILMTTDADEQWVMGKERAVGVVARVIRSGRGKRELP